MSALYLAAAYLRFHWARSLVLVAVIALIVLVPLATRVLVSAAEDRLTARAEATPLILGRRGSALDLAMNALYFSDERPEPVTMAAVEAIWDGGLGVPIPLHTAFEARGHRIVGTTLDYFDLRGLEVADGRALAVLGDAVLGAGAARDLGLGVGDALVSSPENLFDLDGVYPLEMPVVGVLERTGTPDDEAVFVDVKTTWVIAGIGHGHEDVVAADAAADGSGDIVAAASVVQFQRITPQNADSFHFHGAPGEHPVTAVVVVPGDARASAILRGRHLDPEGTTQVIVPADVIGGLVERIFRVRALLDAVVVVIGAAALAAVGLAMFLGMRLREREIETAVKIGAGRGMIARMVAAEAVMILCASCAIAGGAVLAIAGDADRWADRLLALGS